jgi:hypothetical protein
MSHPFWLMAPNQQLNNDHIQELASLELVQQSQSSQVLPYTLFSFVGHSLLLLFNLHQGVLTNVGQLPGLEGLNCGANSDELKPNWNRK